MIDIADDMPLLVDAGEGAGEVRRDVEEEREGRVRELAQPRLRAVEDVDLAMRDHGGHQDAAYRAIRDVVQRRGRPGGDGAQLRGGELRHRVQLRRFLGGDGGVVNLGDGVGMPANRKDLPLAAARERRA